MGRLRIGSGAGNRARPELARRIQESRIGGDRIQPRSQFGACFRSNGRLRHPLWRFWRGDRPLGLDFGLRGDFPGVKTRFAKP